MSRLLRDICAMHAVRFNDADGESSSTDAECSSVLLRSTDNSKWIMSQEDERGRNSRKEAEICNWITSGKMHNIGRPNLKILSFLVLTYVTFLLSLYLPGVGANQNVIWCLDSSEEQLLNLSCGSTSLIRINSVIHGWRTVRQEADPNGCLAPIQDNCAEKYPNVRLLLDTCSGLSTCVISSLEMPAPLSSCSGRRSNYVYITYECVLAGNETTIIDICDSRLKRHGPLRTGYITSPNYPQNYDANTKCSCLLSTSSVDGEPGSTEVVLQLLDFELSLVPNERSPFDWLQYGRMGRNWGDGRMMGAGGSPLATADPIFTGSNRVDVDFNTDEQHEGRGFWLKVIGVNITSKEEIPVEIECGLYTPPDSRQAVSCFDPPRSGELYLSCTAYGVINVLSVRAGYRPHLNQTSDLQLKSCSINDVVEQATCISEVNIPVIGSQCMRRTTCNPPAPSSVNITAACGDHTNDFVLVDYQCIPDSSQSGNMVNVCGDDMVPGTTLFRPSGSGFISSPLYPSNYPPNCNCFCRLEVTSSSTLKAAQLVFYVLDLKLGRTPDEELGNSVCSSLASGCSNSDWLIYGGDGQSPGIGRNLSLEEKGKPVYTGSHVVLISFHSDSQVEDRGFWMKYVGRSVDGSNLPVIVQCGRFQLESGPGSTQGGGNSTGPSSPTGTTGGDGIDQTPNGTVHNNTGLIIGVTLAVIIVIAVLVALIAVCLYRRRRARIQSAKILNESKTNSWNSGVQGLSGFSSSDRGDSLKKNKLFARWKRSTNKTRPIDKQRSSPFAIFYNEAYKMQDPTIYRSMHSSVRKKRLSPPPTDETLHF